MFSKPIFLAALLLGALLTFTVLSGAQAAEKRLTIGSKAPDFTGETQEGKPFHLSDHLGKQIIVLYFYPKDETPVCTKEACSFRDAFQDFQTAGAEVIGVSADTVQSHQKFAEHHKLPFTLISDPDNKIRKLYTVPSTMGVFPGRVTYVIDKKGIIRLTFNSAMDSEKHVTEALKVIRTL
jgi:thioredoxin-dependent peroxiredoxin